jgi:hypothetical protein
MKKTVAFLILLTLFASGYFRNSSSALESVHADEARAKWTKTEIPLKVYRHEAPGGYGHASAEGFWQSTSPSKGRQLLFPIAVKISCERGEHTCREADAIVQLGILKSELLEYDISAWTEAGIVADDSDEGACGIAHRLSIDFKDNSVTVTDYPKKVNNDELCKGFQDANSYALHGGQLMLYPPAAWDPLAKSRGKG